MGLDNLLSGSVSAVGRRLQTATRPFHRAAQVTTVACDCTGGERETERETQMETAVIL